jgi:formylmethanofuran dehydrogenase subunit E-like metal-binding protein
MGARRPESDPHMCLGLIAGYELFGRCTCGASRRLAIAPLARRYGKLTHYTYLQQLMVCGTCGEKGMIRLTKVRWDERDPKPEEMR